MAIETEKLDTENEYALAHMGMTNDVAVLFGVPFAAVLFGLGMWYFTRKDGRLPWERGGE
ncbi:MAG: hypothetical protein AAB439_01320 [Patescibacteria group bacterium]